MTDLHARPSRAKSHNASDSVAHYIAQVAEPTDSTILGIFDVLRDGWNDKKSSGDAPNVVAQITALAMELELERPAEFAEAFQVLVRGAAATPHESRVQALFLARGIARLMISSHRIGSSIDDYDLPDIVGFTTTPAESVTTPHVVVPVTAKPSALSFDANFDFDLDLAV